MLAKVKLDLSEEAEEFEAEGQSIPPENNEQSHIIRRKSRITNVSKTKKPKAESMRRLATTLRSTRSFASEAIMFARKESSTSNG